MEQKGSSGVFGFLTDALKPLYKVLMATASAAPLAPEPVVESARAAREETASTSTGLARFLEFATAKAGEFKIVGKAGGKHDLATVFETTVLKDLREKCVEAETAAASAAAKCAELEAAAVKAREAASAAGLAEMLAKIIDTCEPDAKRPKLDDAEGADKPASEPAPKPVPEPKPESDSDSASDEGEDEGEDDGDDEASCAEDGYVPGPEPEPEDQPQYDYVVLGRAWKDGPEYWYYMLELGTGTTFVVDSPVVTRAPGRVYTPPCLSKYAYTNKDMETADFKYDSYTYVLAVPIHSVDPAENDEDEDEETEERFYYVAAVKSRGAEFNAHARKYDLVFLCLYESDERRNLSAFKEGDRVRHIIDCHRNCADITGDWENIVGDLRSSGTEFDDIHHMSVYEDDNDIFAERGEMQRVTLANMRDMLTLPAKRKK